MKIVNNNSLDLSATRGEQLTLSLQSGDALVTYNGFGVKGTLLAGQPVPLIVPASHESLLVRATFKSGSGGSAEVRISDMQGHTAPFTFVQFPGSATDAIVFSIDVA